MNDLSFIRLEPNFNDAKFTRPSTYTLIYQYGQIILKPNSFYLQTTNCPLGIAFDGNYAVYVIDCDGVELQNITDNVAINERTINGIPQIDFEIANIGTDYYAKTVFLKFVHTVSNYVWYSNPLNITNYYNGQVTRFDYEDATDSYYKSIDLGCYFTVNDSESVSSEYVTYNGKKITSRLINNPTPGDDLEIELLKEHVKYFIYGRERGELGTPHYQGYVQFRHPVRCS